MEQLEHPHIAFITRYGEAPVEVIGTSEGIFQTVDIDEAAYVALMEKNKEKSNDIIRNQPSA